MEYTAFRKNFYVEVPEIARMTPEEVEAYKEVLHTVAIITHACFY
jgi:ATP-dependent RNA helicase DDX46/PRP5